MSDDLSIAERISKNVSQVFAGFWLAELRVIEERIPDPIARWEILRQALTLVSQDDSAKDPAIKEEHR